MLPFALVAASCAPIFGSKLRPGQDSEADVLRTMGQPAMRWQNPDGSRQLAYPQGPVGVHGWMVFLGQDGKLERIDNVMEMKSFARIKPGMSKGEVLRVLGPPVPARTIYFPARDELVWEWRYCDDWNAPARFNVFFDGTGGYVRSTLSLTEDQIGMCGPNGGCSCAR